MFYEKYTNNFGVNKGNEIIIRMIKLKFWCELIIKFSRANFLDSWIHYKVEERSGRFHAVALESSPKLFGVQYFHEFFVHHPPVLLFLGSDVTGLWWKSGLWVPWQLQSFKNLIRWSRELPVLARVPNV